MGVELIPYEEETVGGKFGVDLGMGYHLRSEGAWASGTLLPSVIDSGESSTAGEVVKIDEMTGLVGRMRLNFLAMGHLRVNLGTSLGYYLPARVEHAYNINYGRTVDLT